MHLKSGTNGTVPLSHVAHYEYDPYGNITEATTYNSDTFGTKNPIRYKAYYYDTDLGWYNLGARYYDPSVGRFINCDSFSLIISDYSDIVNKNTYNYCNNNPIMYFDYDGKSVWPAVYLIGCAVFSVSVDYAEMIYNGEEYNKWYGILAIISGLVAGTSPNLGGRTVSVGIDFISNRFFKNKSTYDCLSEAISGIVSGKLEQSMGKLIKLSSSISNLGEFVDTLAVDKIGKTTDWAMTKIAEVIPGINKSTPDKNRTSAKIVRTVTAMVLCPLLYWYDVLTGKWQ